MSIFREISEKIGYAATGGYNIVNFGGKHVYVDPTDGNTYPMYQTTAIDCQQI